MNNSCSLCLFHDSFKVNLCTFLFIQCKRSMTIYEVLYFLLVSIYFVLCSLKEEESSKQRLFQFSKLG